MNIVIYAGDMKYYSVLRPIADVLKTTSENFLFYYTKSTQLLYPSYPPHICNFEYDGQVDEGDDAVTSETLKLQIPFQPKILILARERWEPEQSIIHEFKTKWNCTVCCIEVSSHLSNNIENRLEMLSRKNYPQNQIDYFFEHSNWAKERRIDCLDETYRNKIIVVGNTRKFKCESFDMNYLRDKYHIDENKQQILFWGVINTTRNIALEALKVLANKTKNTHQIFYKCYPGEPYNTKFQKDFNPFCIPGVRVIYDESDIEGMAWLCDTHIAAASSVFNFAFANNKKIVNLDSVCQAGMRMNDINVYLSEIGIGVEDSAKFWMDVWKLKSIEEFKKLIDMSRIDQFIKTNKQYYTAIAENTLDFDWECNFLYREKTNYNSLLPYFDEYNMDGLSANRIVNFLIQNQ